MENLDEIWAYDEPHESGGNIHVTMTKSQAVAYMRACYPRAYNKSTGDEEAFAEWVSVHWAYRVTQEAARGAEESE